MKIGIITFHWATNYGAVLQAFALQKYLSNKDHTVEIINYIPAKYEVNIYNCFKSKNPLKILLNIFKYKKELRLKVFRNKYFNTTKIKYTSIDDLKRNPPNFDAYICGSDQVWNPTFTLEGEGEGKVTLSYFLDFGSNYVKKISYAASFGCVNYPVNCLDIIKSKLDQFDAISVRENSGKDILRKIGIYDSCIVPDPTLMLSESDYEKILSKKNEKNKNYIYIYSLHSNQKLIKKIKKDIKQYYKYSIIDSTSLKHMSIGIDEWLKYIKNSNLVITNSFHGTIFSILFKKNFVVIPVEGENKEMNDRIYTLLESLNLRNHFIEEYDDSILNHIISQPIDWNAVDSKIKLLRNNADFFLSRHL